MDTGLFITRMVLKKKKGSLVNGNADGLWVFYDDNSKKSQEGSFSNGTKKGSGQLGLKMVDYLKVTMQTVKRMPLGQVGGIMKELKRKCREIIKMDKWLINGFFMTKMAI